MTERSTLNSLSLILWILLRFLWGTAVLRPPVLGRLQAAGRRLWAEGPTLVWQRRCRSISQTRS